MVKKVTWNAENDRKLLLQLLPRDTKEANFTALASMYEGATPKAIEERIAKLKREKKSTDLAAFSPTGTTTMNPIPGPSTPPSANSTPRKSKTTKSATTGEAFGMQPAPSRGRKGGRGGGGSKATGGRGRAQVLVADGEDDEEVDGGEKVEMSGQGEREGSGDVEMGDGDVGRGDGGVEGDGEGGADGGKGKGVKRVRTETMDGRKDVKKARADVEGKTSGTSFKAEAMEAKMEDVVEM